MIVLKERDYFEIRLASLIADYDKDIIVNLYQPIIGYTASMVYFTLWSESKNSVINSLIDHKTLFQKMKISVTDFISSRKLLEGMGLLKTYLKKEKDFAIYTYELFAPKSPKDFFNNTLFYGMLIKETSEAFANKLKNVYSLNVSLENGEEISTSFASAFNPNLDDPVFIKALQNNGVNIGRTNGKINYNFSYEVFADSLKEISQINPEEFLKKEMKEIERLATLNGISEKRAAEGVSNVYDFTQPKGKRIDFAKLTKIFQNENAYLFIKSVRDHKDEPNLVSSTKQLGNKVNLLESVSPKDYLSILQNGSQPASADLKLINDLSLNFHLPNSVINALVDYVLATNNNVLSRPYTEKVAASLARENVSNAVDAMNYLRKVNKRKSNKSEEPLEKEENETSQENELDWDEVLNEIDKQ